jgi:hypothetical protein
MSLDRGTKIYAYTLGSLVLAGVLIWLLNLDLRLGEIDDMLQQEKDISAYPYKFRALEIKGTTAILSTPRSTSMPAVQFLGMIRPGLANKSEQDPVVIEAQRELGALQSKIKKLVLTRQDIDKVRWRLDKEWYAARGILIQ